MDSIFIIAARNNLPQPTTLAKQIQTHLPDAILDTDWDWESVEGWLPVTVSEDDAGFEVVVDSIGPDSNEDFAVADRPELNTVIELTPGGGFLCGAAALAFAAAFADLAPAAVDMGDDEVLDEDALRESAKHVIADLVKEHESEKRAGEALDEARESGVSDRDLLEDAVASLVGKQIIFRAGAFMLRFEDNSMISGPCCEIREAGETIIEHGFAAKIRDQQFMLLREHSPDVPKAIMSQINRMNGDIHRAEAEDEKAIEEIFALTEPWLNSVQVNTAILDGGSTIQLELSDGHELRFTSTDNSSMITLQTPTLSFTVNGDSIRAHT